MNRTSSRSITSHNGPKHFIRNSSNNNNRDDGRDSSEASKATPTAATATDEYLRCLMF